MISFQFLATSLQVSHAHAEIELLYLLNGRLQLRVGGNDYALQSDDFVMINSGTVHEYVGSDDLLLGEFHILPDKLAEALGRTDLRFRCNSTVTDVPERYEAVRDVLREICSRFHQDSRDTLRMYALYYRLLHLLCANFLTAPQSAPEPLPAVSSRTGEIMEYIRLNYDKPLRLGDLADQLHLSVAYLSKYIKKHLGMSFLDYVSQVRLSHAVTALLHTDAPVARIAMDTGFANLSSFNKVFRETYHTTPTAFRQQNRTALPLDDALPLPEAETPPEPSTPPQEEPSQLYLIVSVPAQPVDRLPSGACSMINIGACADLLRSDIREQVLLLRDRLGLTHIRFWDLYAPEMLLDRPASDGHYSFQRLDRVLDFLLENRLKPYMELGNKPRQVFLTNPRRPNSPYRRQTEVPPMPDELLRQLIRHLHRRYGAKELQSWYFELWNAEIGESGGTDEEAIRAYLDRFEQLHAIFTAVVPELQLGGGGFSLRFGEDALARAVALWSQRSVLPSFFSLYCYPTFDQSDKAAVLENQLVNPNTLKSSLAYLRRLIENTPLQDREIHVTEWNISVNQRNILNDSYFKGAYMVKNLLDSRGLADLFGYWLASDLYAEGADSALPLFGGCGIVTRDGIPKPSWYALEFLQELGDELYAQGDNYIVTRDSAGAWRILCHNFKHFNYQYYLYEDEQLPEDHLETLLADTSVLNIRFELPAREQARFRLKRSRIGLDSGNVKETWLRGGRVQQPGPEELADLQRASVPQTTLGSLSEQGGVLRFQVRLEYNETLLLVLTPQGS